MEKYYRFANVEIAVQIPDGYMYPEDRQLAPFRVQQVHDPHVFRFRVVDSLADPQGKPAIELPGVRIYREGERHVRYMGSVENGWENAYLRAEYGQRETCVQVRLSDPLTYIPVKIVLNALCVEHLVTESGGFVFHCAYIAFQGKAILFTAPSGTGKSTQAELWAKYKDAKIVNGDRAVVCKADTLRAEGIPFSGSSTYCSNHSLPITAIVYLSQAPKTTIRRLRGMEAFFKIWEGVSVNTWNKEDMERVSQVVQQAAGEIPVYHLACTPDLLAVEALEEALRKQESL